MTSTMEQTETGLPSAAPGRLDARAIRATARWAGVFYLGLTAASIFGYFYVPARFFVAGDATATAAKIVADVQLYRFALLSAFIGQISFVCAALALYQLFRDVHRPTARALLVLVCVGVAVEVGDLVNRAAPLVLLSGAGFLDVFTRPQLDALSYAFTRVGATLGQLVTMIWGLWLFPFGYLALRSRFFPRFLGILLYISGFAYVVTSIADVGFPDQAGLVTRIMTPLYFGELAMVLWLPIMGAKVRAEVQAGHPAAVPGG